jgi:DNA invertase Pin-like site-specific DNA recombinase
MKQAANEVISIRQAQDVAAQVEPATHPLEFNAAEREWFLKACNNYVTAYRRAVEALTGSLPTWAGRQSAGRPQSIGTEHHEEIRELLALGVPVSTVARRYDTSRATITRIRDAEEGGAAQGSEA